jgi:hypothetical protein
MRLPVFWVTLNMIRYSRTVEDGVVYALKEIVMISANILQLVATMWDEV